MQSVFNRHSKKPFAEIKDKLNQEAHLHYKVHFNHKELTVSEKETIKNNIRLAEARRTIKALVITFILAIPITFFVIDLVQRVMSH